MTYSDFQQLIKTVPAKEDCPVLKTLHLLSGRWTSFIIYELQKHERVRFGELKKNLHGITNSMLSSTLKTLEAEGIVIREQFNEIPPRVEYSLSEAGRDMCVIYYEIAKWGLKHTKMLDEMEE